MPECATGRATSVQHGAEFSRFFAGKVLCDQVISGVLLHAYFNDMPISGGTVPIVPFPRQAFLKTNVRTAFGPRCSTYPLYMCTSRPYIGLRTQTASRAEGGCADKNSSVRALNQSGMMFSIRAISRI